ncbi:MAG: antibiotic biosynthesis monooxygenase [Rhizobiaceae bacterium]|nr:antibiotic biosynthesis monooxygenase [Rhizobiaceae bacterium]
MSELFIVVGITSKPGKEDDLRRDLAALVEPSRGEEGNIRYDLFEDLNEPGKFVFVEHWENAGAQQKHHEESEHIRHFHEHGEANVAGRDFVRLLRPVSGGIN